MNHPTFLMLIGLPGSGKSHWTKNFLVSNPDYVVISSDDIIEEKCAEVNCTYSEGFEKFIGYATSEMKRRFKMAISEGKNIILDQTNMSKKSRSSKMQQLSDDYVTTAVVFIVPDNILKDRLKKREEETGKVIPPFVITTMARSYNAPTKDEFDKIIYIK
jgi:predicted kinase